jgi:hypothetical protein
VFFFDSRVPAEVDVMQCFMSTNLTYRVISAYHIMRMQWTRILKLGRKDQVWEIFNFVLRQVEMVQSF